jgi:nucleoside phosphorylase
MTELPTELYTRCRNTLLKCSEFDTNASLRTVFVTAELAPFRAGLPEADSKSARVDACLAYLADKHLSDGRTMLPLFLGALRDRYNPGDALRDELAALVAQFEADVAQATQAVAPSAGTAMQNTRSAPGSVPDRADFLIVTPLEEERDAVLARLPGYQRALPSAHDIHVYYWADLDTHRVVVLPLLKMGRVQAAAATNDAIRRWAPEYVILVGIAGGVAARGMKLGDVLIADQIVDYELQKLTAEGPDIRWQVFPTDPLLLGIACNLTAGEWQGLVAAKRPGGRGAPGRHTGPIASGDKVIAFDEALAKYRDTWSKLIGVEMEAGGVAVSALQAAARPRFFMVRGVSDLADKEKGTARVEKWRAYACDVAAAYAFAILGAWAGGRPPRRRAEAEPLPPTSGASDALARPATPAMASGDSYTRYEAGVRYLLERLGRGHPRYGDALVYQQRLHENLANARRYGDTETRRVERAEIVAHLNDLSLAALRVSFNELCDLSPASAAPVPGGTPPRPTLRINPDRPPIATIRELLTAAFTPEDLRRFCQDRPAFRAVVASFGPGHGLDDMVDRVIEHCRTQLLWEELLTDVAQVRPRQYARLEPRLHEHNPPEWS